MELFRLDNTDGYGEALCKLLNRQWERRVIEKGLSEQDDPEEYEREAKAFQDEVSKR